MLAPAPSVPGPDALLTPLAPGAAYAADVARLNGRAPIGAADDAWLALAQVLARAAELPVRERARVLAAGGRTLTALVPADAPAPVRNALGAAGAALGTLGDALGRGVARRAARDGAEAGEVRAAVDALQGAVAQAEQAGAFLLAFSTLAAARDALAPVLDRRAEGLVLAQQGRVARQVGALVMAAELYAQSVRAARAARAPDVLARALIGRGALASMRGNYPEARTLFRRGLRLANRVGAEEHRRAAHHGLLLAALIAGDSEAALAHGWEAFQSLPDSATDARAEMLVNMGDAGRRVGEYRASIGAFLTAIELTDNARIVLPALGGAALAAAQLGDEKLLTIVVRAVERTVGRSGQVWEEARALVEVAEAYELLRDTRALFFAERAETLARSGPFHEISARAENVRASWATARASTDVRRSAGASWSAGTRTVLAALENMPATAPSTALSACGVP